MKLSEITKRFQGTNAGEDSTATTNDDFSATLTIFDQVRHTYNGVKQNAAAAYATFLYDPPTDWYLRLDTAVGHVHNKFPIPLNVVTSITQMDDLLFSGGYAYTINNKARITMSGLFGVPVHHDVSLLGSQFGTGHIGLGVQFDGVYAYSDDQNSKLIGAGRYVRFLARNAELCFNGQRSSVHVVLGNLLDLLFAINNTSGNHQWELGYDVTFAFSAFAPEPAVLATYEDQSDFIRSSFYATYGYSFSIRGHQSNFVVGTLYGFDHRDPCLGYKRIAAAWITWGMQF